MDTTIVDNLYQRIMAFDAKGDKNEYAQQIYRAVLRAAQNNKTLRFVSFTCSTINSEYMLSDTPWLYVNTQTIGNNLEPDMPRLCEIMKAVRAVYQKIALTIVIGNTDPYYIYLQQCKNFSDAQKYFVLEKFVGRWRMYRDNLKAWLNAAYPSLQATVVSWYEFEKEMGEKIGRSFEREFDALLNASEQYFNADDLAWELRALKQQFGPGKYFSRLPLPDEVLTRDWVARKFSEYALQALWLYDYMPGSILIQNEKPSFLRSKMYQPLVRALRNDALPIVYFFGVDNSGYR